MFSRLRRKEEKPIIRKNNPFVEARVILSFAVDEIFSFKVIKFNKQVLVLHELSKGQKAAETEFYAELSGFNAAGKHDNMVNFVEAFETETDFVLALEHSRLGLLDEYWSKFQETCTEKEVRDIIQQCASALNYLLQKKFVHRNFSPSAILVRSRKPTNVAVTSLRFSKKVISSKQTTQLTTNVGEALFKAPEVEDFDIRKGIGGYVYNYKADIYSLGATAHFMLTAGASTPYFELPKDIAREIDATVKGREKRERRKREAKIQYYETITNEGVELMPKTHWSMISKEANNCVKEMIVPILESRPSYKEILGSSWLNKKYKHSQPALNDLFDRARRRDDKYSLE